MEVSQALDFINLQLVAEKLKNLNTLESTIFKEAWKGKPGMTYSQIGDNSGYPSETVKNTAYDLWLRLSKLCGEKVSQKNLQAVVERYWRSISKTGLQSGQMPPVEALTLFDSQPEQVNPNFVGRESSIAHLNSLVRQGAKVIVIQAAGGVGKTTLARQFLQSQGFDLVLELLMAKEKENITSVESAIEEWLKQDLQEEPGREFGVMLGRLKRQLQSRKVGVSIDNLEPALDKQGKLIESHRRYVELLRVLGDSTVQSVTLITSRDRLCDSDVNVEHYLLPGLDEQAWQQFFRSRNINIDAPTLKAMHKAYGGNAKAMGIICGTIREDFDGDMAAYWLENSSDPLVETDLKNLVTSQFNRLQEIDIEAYRLLCRLGCYRYQDVPTVPKEGLFCLLWDVSELERRRIIESLRNRSLIECHKREYWLHPVIREEAIDRLRKSEEWEDTNRKAADFWTDSVKTVETVQDALTAFEAYYHYIYINDLNLACSIILRRRYSKLFGWRRERLGYEFWRLGLLQPIIPKINQIINKIIEPDYLSTLYLILGYSNNLIGCIKEAKKYHIISGNIAAEYLLTKYNEEILCKDKLNDLKALKVVSLINIGCCQMDLWEIEEAIKSFEQCCLIAEDYDFPRYAVDSWFCLAYLNSCLGFSQKAFHFAEKASNQLSITTWSAWSEGYSLLFLGLAYNNLGEISKSWEMYRKAIEFAQKSNYPLVKGKALTGLAELYREQQEFQEALLHHLESIEILDNIGAKCDLAEAYFQLALTYQKIGDSEKSQANFQEAIRLFSEIQAPKQVEKVRRAMESDR